MDASRHRAKHARRRRIICQGLARRTGLIEAIDRRLHLLKVHLPYVLNIAYNILAGGTCLEELDVDFVSVNSGRLNEKLIARARVRQMGVHAWTVNDRQTMSAMIDLGVENIITDDPAMLVELLEGRARLNDVERVILSFRRRLAR